MDDSSEGNEMWQFMLAVTNKKDWYMKVHAEDIVDKWRDELSDTVKVLREGEFELAIGILRATSQGSMHLADCDWDYDLLVCDACRERAKQYVRDNPGDFGVGDDEYDSFVTVDALFEEDEDDEWLYDLVNGLGEEFCEHSRCKCICPDYMLKDYVRYFPQDRTMISHDIYISINTLVRKLMDSIPVDWHPGSNEQVRDIVHPSMYPYVKGISLLGKTEAVEPYEDTPENEATRYQWLPANMVRGDDKTFTFASYVNNFPDFWSDPERVKVIENVFNKFTGAFSKVTGMDLREFNELQVIVKIGSVHLDTDKPKYPGGSWHIEGMPHEHIVATALYYVHVEGISDSFLEFRKPVVLNDMELDYPQSDAVHTTAHYGISPGSHFNGKMNRYLGLVKCEEGASVVFPNTLQHRVKSFRLLEGATEGSRIIIAFFLVDPKHPITSTADVPPQQDLMSIEDAHYHRERLMYHRKYFADTLNAQVYEREFSLCEH
jgi:hypothetical protein